MRCSGDFVSGSEAEGAPFHVKQLTFAPTAPSGPACVILMFL